MHPMSSRPARRGPTASRRLSRRGWRTYNLLMYVGKRFSQQPCPDSAFHSSAAVGPHPSREPLTSPLTPRHTTIQSGRTRRLVSRGLGASTSQRNGQTAPISGPAAQRQATQSPAGSGLARQHRPSHIPAKPRHRAARKTRADMPAMRSESDRVAVRPENAESPR